MEWKDIGQQKEMDEHKGVMGNQLLDYCDIGHRSQRGRRKTFGELEQGAKHVRDQIWRDFYQISSSWEYSEQGRAEVGKQMMAQSMVPAPGSLWSDSDALVDAATETVGQMQRARMRKVKPGWLLSALPEDLEGQPALRWCAEGASGITGAVKHSSTI